MSPEKLDRIGGTQIVGGGGSSAALGDDLREIATALHDLCQPLTALQCRLEIGNLVGTPAGYQEAVAEGLRESTRLLQRVSQMRDLVRNAMERH